MRIVQMLPMLAYGDAIGNDVLAIDEVLRRNGYDTAIYAGIIDDRLLRNGIMSARQFVDDADTVILYHLSTGEKLNETVYGYTARLVIIYHNITPGEYFKNYEVRSMTHCDRGIRNARKLAERAEFAIADSEFNKKDLIELGYTCPIEVIPILIAFSDYEAKPNASVISRYKDDGYTNILFTGRVAPNKKHEDLIESFYYYHEYINKKSRLILVGKYGEDDRYYESLCEYMNRLGVSDVIFTGHTKFDEILAYYQIADVFLCLSEHEGFCVPLVEAMYFDVPIIAYDSTAVGDTLGGAGILLSDKDPRVVAEAINLVMTDNKIKNRLISLEQARLKDFEHKKIEEKLLRVIKSFER